MFYTNNKTSFSSTLSCSSRRPPCIELKRFAPHQPRSLRSSPLNSVASSSHVFFKLFVLSLSRKDVHIAQVLSLEFGTQPCFGQVAKQTNKQARCSPSTNMEVDNLFVEKSSLPGAHAISFRVMCSSEWNLKTKRDKRTGKGACRSVVSCSGQRSLARGSCKRKSW